MLVVVNRKAQPSVLDIEWNNTHLTSEIRGNSVATYRWDGSSD